MENLALLLGKKKKTPIPNDENVVFLSHFEEEPPINVATGEAATRIAQNFNVSPSIVLNNPSQAKFGQGYMKHTDDVNAVKNSYTFPKNFTIADNDFTIDSWHAWDDYTVPNGAGQYGWEIGADVQDYRGLMLNGTRYSGGLYLDINRKQGTAPPKRINIPGLNNRNYPVTDYFHVAVVKEGTEIRVYLRGILATTLDIGTLAIYDGPLIRLGKSTYDDRAGCRLDEMRIVVGQALYTGSSIDVPTGPFPDPVIQA